MLLPALFAIGVSILIITITGAMWSRYLICNRGISFARMGNGNFFTFQRFKCLIFLQAVCMIAAVWFFIFSAW